jgi:hypothetical protein
MQGSQFTGSVVGAQGDLSAASIYVRALTLCMASCTMKCVGRLAQRLERSVYTRKVVRSNRTVPTICAQYRITLSGDVVQLVRTLPCHGRGREFESRRPRHSFQEVSWASPPQSLNIR